MPNSAELVRANLVRIGAPIVTKTKKTKRLSLEETLVSALDLARKDSTVARSLPVAIARNRNSLDLASLKKMARKKKVLPVLGFYLELTALLSKDRELKLFAKSLKDGRRKKMEQFFNLKPKNQFERKLAESNTPLLARKWLFLINIRMDSFESLFRKFIRSK